MKFEFDLGDATRFGLSPGLGVLFPHVSGTFTGGDAVSAAKAEAYFSFKVADRVRIAPVIFYIVPLSDSRGGVAGGPTSPLEIDPFWGGAVRAVFAF